VQIPGQWWHVCSVFHIASQEEIAMTDSEFANRRTQKAFCCEVAIFVYRAA
jgi:hypothetical protein